MKAAQSAKGIYQIGFQLRHDPNRVALDRFVRDVLPLILARRPEVRLVIAGSDPPPPHAYADNAGHPSGYKNAVLNQMLNNSVPGPTYYVMNFNRILDVVNPALDKVWLGTATAQQAMDSIAAQAQALVNGRRPSK